MAILNRDVPGRLMRPTPSNPEHKVKGQKEEITPYLKHIIARLKRAFAAIFIFSLFTNLLMLAVPIYLLQIYGKVIPNKSTETLLFLTIIIVVAIIALAILEGIKRILAVKLGIWFEKNIAQHILSTAISDSVRHDTEYSTGMIGDLTQVRQFISSGPLLTILDLPWSPLYITFLYFLHSALGNLAVFAALLLFAIAYLNDLSTRSLVQQSQSASRQAIHSASTYARNADVIEAMGMRNQIMQKWGAEEDYALDLTAKHDAVNAKINAVVQFIRLFLQIAVIGLAAWLILKGELSAGATIASILLMRWAVSPLENSINSWKSIMKAREAFRRINDNLNKAPSLKVTYPTVPPAGAISAENISYFIPRIRKAVFQRINFSINPGEAVALIGPSGTGKTTLARILIGLIPPSHGRIRVGGVDIRDFAVEQRNEMIGYLPQNIELFSGTIRENIARMQQGDIRKVAHAAQMAQIHHIIQKFPQGYDSDIGENGAYLSGGQRQRIALARALYGSPKLVIMDEPDSNLDADGRAALSIAIQKLKKQGAIILIITHRASSQQFMDKVIELKNGQILVSSSSSPLPRNQKHPIHPSPIAIR